MKEIILTVACMLSSVAVAEANRVTVNCDGAPITMPLYQDVKMGDDVFNLLVGYEPGAYLLVNVVDLSSQKCSGPIHLARLKREHSSTATTRSCLPAGGACKLGYEHECCSRRCSADNSLAWGSCY